MKLLMILLLGYTLHAEILQVRQLFNYKTATVTKRTLHAVKTYYGKTAVDETKVYDVTLRFDAFVTKLYADETYQKVRKGQPLFRLYSREVVSLLEELKLSRTLSRRAAANTRRKLRLLGLGNLADGKRSDTFDYAAPAEGYILSRSIQAGSFAGRGRRLMQIADFSTLWVIADIYQRDLPFVHNGTKAKIEVEGFPAVEGSVEKIYPKVDPATQTVPVRIVLHDNRRLFPGLFAKIRLLAATRTGLVLPKTAVIEKGGKQYVFLPEGEGRFAPKAIVAKRFNSHEYLILSGLKEGEKVADKALFLLDSDALTNGLYSDADEDEDW